MPAASNSTQIKKRLEFTNWKILGAPVLELTEFGEKLIFLNDK
jgi:hypothetical protein